MAEIKFDPSKTTLRVTTPDPNFMCYCVNCFHSDRTRTNPEGTCIRCTRFSRWVFPLERCEEYLCTDEISREIFNDKLQEHFRKISNFIVEDN